jgi:hypothetical protein
MLRLTIHRTNVWSVIYFTFDQLFWIAFRHLEAMATSTRKRAYGDHRVPEWVKGGGRTLR